MAKSEKVTSKGKDEKVIQTLPVKKQDKIAGSKSPSKPLSGNKSVSNIKAQVNPKAEPKKTVETKQKVEKKNMGIKEQKKSPAKPSVKKTEVKKVELKKVEPKKVESKKPEIKKEVAKKEEPKKVEAKKPEVKKEAAKKVELKKVEPKKVEAKKPEVKKEVAKKVEVKKVEPKKVETKKPEVKKEAAKKVDVKTQVSKQTDKSKKNDSAIKNVELKEKLLPILKETKETKEIKVKVTKPVSDKKKVVEIAPEEEIIPSERPTVRYSDEDLEMFGSVISESRRDALEELRMLKERLEDLTNYDFAEESMIYSMHMAEQGSEAMEKEKTYAQIQRIHEYIKKLDDALDRIKNKTYGICRVCNCLIAKERLLAVPITTLSASYKIHQKCPPDGIDIIEPVKEQKEPLGVE